MKELALSKRFFEEYGQSIIEDQFSAYGDRIAAGLVGSGSGCFGYDDEISRDHDWGPGFCLFLTKADFQAIGKRIQVAYNNLPTTYLGFTRTQSALGAGRTGVFEISAFYQTFITIPESPADYRTWRLLPEQYLATCTNGAVFQDPLGEFSRRRQVLLDFYPEDIRLNKIAARCMTIAQAGQYNLPRLFKRDEPVASRYSETKFIADTISLAFLLNKKYTPFYKWMHRALKDLPQLGANIAQQVDALIRETVNSQKQVIVESICGELIGELKRQGLTDSDSDFLLEHGPSVQERIQDDQLRAMGAWVE